MIGRRSIFAGLLGLVPAAAATPSIATATPIGAVSAGEAGGDSLLALRLAAKAGLVSPDVLRAAIIRGDGDYMRSDTHWTASCRSFAPHARARIMLKEHHDRRVAEFLDPKDDIWSLARKFRGNA